MSHRKEIKKKPPLNKNCIRKSVFAKPTENIVNKIYNRETFGHFTSKFKRRKDELPFKKIPERLSFCLKDLIPYCYLDDHIFMGLTSCGQFLLSYTVVYEEDENADNYNFSNSYKYKLFFWIYRPHCKLVNYYEVCLFDDHGVDNLKTVSMIQWIQNPRILIVHGASECENEESFITYATIPKMGCGDCNEIRKNESDENYKTDTLCVGCNLTIHTKYNRTDSDPVLVPNINFNYPDHLIMVSNGFIHIVNVKLEANKSVNSFRLASYPQQQVIVNKTMNEMLIGGIGGVSVVQQNEEMHNNENKTVYLDNSVKREEDAGSMVAKIIADFAECETKSSVFELITKMENCTELKINCHVPGNVFNDQISPNIGFVGSSNMEKKDKSISAGSHQIDIQTSNRLRPRKGIVNNFRNRLGSTFEAGPSTSSSNNVTNKRLEAYEFSEETEEKCEKISLFRKKRLADKKYEFSEDNSENIVPFNRIRTTSKIRPFSSSLLLPQTSPNYQQSFSGASPSSSHYDIPNHVHRASPNYGFRSPCGSPIGNRCLRSPPAIVGGRTNFVLNQQRSPTYVTSMLSPSSSKQPHNYIKKFSYFPSYNNSIFSSPKRNCELQEILPSNHQTVPTTVPLTNEAVNEPEKPICSKKVIRRFVEETDAASVITNEEDDCISPGYHTSLPMEVHGSCYSDMQMISLTSLQKLQCPFVQVTQNSFDLEQFTYYVTNYLCDKHNKNHGLFYDWACELVSVCKFSGIATCILMVHFTATDKKAQTKTRQKKTPIKTTFFGEKQQKDVKSETEETNYDCINCSSNLDCVFHRKHYQCCSLFTWDIVTGSWKVLDYGELNEISGKGRNHHSNNKKQAQQLRNAVKDLALNLRHSVQQNCENIEKEPVDEHLRILDSRNEKSKESLTDLKNCIQFYKGKIAGHSSLYSEMADFYDNSNDEEDEEMEDEEDEDNDEY